MNALITGASKGIGRAIAKAFANEGCDLVLVSRTLRDLAVVKQEIKLLQPSITIHILAADVSTQAGIKTLMTFIRTLKIDIDILVNNAGVFLPGEIKNSAVGNLEKMMDTNFFSAYYLTRELLPHLLTKKSGAIFNICSIASLDSYPNGSDYCISKFALYGFSKCLRQELKESGIKVISVLPDATWTDSWKGVDLPNERLMQADDIGIMMAASLKLSPSAVVEDIILRPQLGDL